MSDRTDENRKKMISPYASFLLFNFVFFMLDTTASYFQIYLSDIGLTKTMIECALKGDGFELTPYQTTKPGNYLYI